MHTHTLVLRNVYHKIYGVLIFYISMHEHTRRLGDGKLHVKLLSESTVVKYRENNYSQ